MKWNSTAVLEDNEIQVFGLSIIPVSSQKIPFKSWVEYQTKIAPIAEWHTHYCNQGTVGIITGKVSGNLEIVDIDVKNDPKGTIMDEYRALNVASGGRARGNSAGYCRFYADCE